MSPSGLLHFASRTGVLSTMGSFGAWTGFPVGTVVEYAMDGGGKPVFAFSSLSSHTPDIKADPRCALTVTAQDFQVILMLHLLHQRRVGNHHCLSQAGTVMHPTIYTSTSATSLMSVWTLLQGMSSGRVTVAGRVALLEGADAADAKKAFLAKNPQSFWVEFGDFSWFRMDSVVTARLVGGFGRIKQVLPAFSSWH